MLLDLWPFSSPAAPASSGGVKWPYPFWWPGDLLERAREDEERRRRAAEYLLLFM